MAYASLDKLKESWKQVSHFSSGRNDFQIMSHGDERQQQQHNVNHDEMMDYIRFMGLDEEEHRRPSHVRYNGEPLQHSPRMIGLGRGRLIKEAARYNGNYNKQMRKDQKVKQQMIEAGISSTTDRDLRAFFMERFKEKDENPEENSELMNERQLEGPAEDVGWVTNTCQSSVFDVNNNDEEEIGERRKIINASLQKPVKTTVYVPPHRRNQEVSIEETANTVGFADLIKKAELEKLEPRPVVERKTISELLANPKWNADKKPKAEGKAPKCRNAIMIQFLPDINNISWQNKQPKVIPAGLEIKQNAASAFGSECNSSRTSSTEDSASEDVWPNSWPSSDKTPTARRMFESFVPEEVKPRNFTLGDFIVTKPSKK